MALHPAIYLTYSCLAFRQAAYFSSSLVSFLLAISLSLATLTHHHFLSSATPHFPGHSTLSIQATLLFFCILLHVQILSKSSRGSHTGQWAGVKSLLLTQAFHWPLSAHAADELQLQEPHKVDFYYFIF
jgi:hypothetical protein